MKKLRFMPALFLLGFVLACASPPAHLEPFAMINFANGAELDEHTIIFSGAGISGFVEIVRDDELIVIMPTMSENNDWLPITGTLSPLIPHNRTVNIRPEITWGTIRGAPAIITLGENVMETIYTDGWESSIIEGNMMFIARSDDSWEEIVTEGNSTLATRSDGSWDRTVREGDMTLFTTSHGFWSRVNRVTSGNTTTFTGSMSDFPTESLIMRLVVSGNTQTLTFPEGHWQRRVVGNNTITVTHSSGDVDEMLVQGNVITITHNGELRTRVERQGSVTHVHIQSRPDGIFGGPGSPLFPDDFLNDEWWWGFTPWWGDWVF
ncbi:MAG: hypothetical protein FWG66_11280 [Spirochaetes bacterium]|nr:hypothetical protein [Spirochaetota bacterium]